jgi:hypothetical protein
MHITQTQLINIAVEENIKKTGFNGVYWINLA